MARVNITIPDEVLARARDAGMNISRIASEALSEQLDRLDKIGELDRYLQELEDELGPIPESEKRKAQAWADSLLSKTDVSRSA